MSALVIVASAVGVVLSATFFVAMILRSTTGESAGVREAWPYGILVGWGTVSLIGFWTRFLGISADAVLLAVGALGCAAFGLLFSLRGRPQEVREPPSSGNAFERIAFGLMSAAVLTSLTLFCVTCAAHPQGAWDAISNWNFLARILHRTQGDLTSVLSAIELGQVGYPYFVPGSIAALWGSNGSENPLASHVVAGSCLVSLFGLTYDFLRRASGRFAARIGTALLASAPLIPIWAGALYADVTFAAVVAGACTGLVSLLFEDQKRRTPSLLIGMTVGFLPWTKNEGLPVAVVLILATGITLLVARVPWRRNLLLIVLAALPGFGAHVALKVTWAPANDHVSKVGGVWRDQLADSTRWSTIAEALRVEATAFGGPEFGEGAIVKQRRFGRFWPALLLVFVSARIPRTRERAFVLLALFLTVIGLQAFLFIIYVLIPTPLPWSLAVSLDRLLVHQLPVVVMFLALLAVPARRGTSAATTPP